MADFRPILRRIRGVAVGLRWGERIDWVQSRMVVAAMLWMMAAFVWPVHAQSGTAQNISDWEPVADGWMFYPGRLIDPAAAVHMPGGGETVSLPHIWSDMPDGGPDGSYGVATYVRQIPPDAGNRHMGMRAGKIRAVYHYYAVTLDESGGTSIYDLGGNGDPGLARESSASGRVFVLDLPRDYNELYLVVTVSNHIYSAAGFLWPPKLAPMAEVRADQGSRIAAYFGFAGLLVAVGVVLSVLSLWHPGSAYYYIGGGLLVVLASRVLIVNNYIWVLLPGLPLEIALRFEYIGLFLIMPGFYWLTLKLYPSEASKTAALVIGIIASLSVLVALAAPLPVMFTLRDPYILISLVGFLLILQVFIRAVRHHRNGAKLALGGVGLAGVGAALDIYTYIPVPITSLETIPFAGLAFTAVLLSLFTVRYRNEQEEKVILARSIELANEELRAHAKRVEAAQAEAAAALDMKNSFLSNISHEVQTPLKAIVNFADRLIEEPRGASSEAKRLDFLKLIRSNGNNLAHLMEDVLNVADLEIGRFTVSPAIVEASRVCEAAVAIIEPVATEKQLLVDIRCNKAQMLIDDRLMRQALIKILSNAVKYSPVNGVVTVRGSLAEDDYVLTVMDTGPGMAAADIPVALSLFGPSNEVTGKPSGTGLGLPLVARFMELLGGDIKIDSIPELGTTVTLSFPMNPPRKQMSVVTGKETVDATAGG